MPSSLTTAGNLRVAVVEDSLGLARESTLQSILSRLDVNLSTIASETTLQQIRDRLPSSLTTAGNFKIAITEDSLGLARDSSLQTIISKLGGGLPSSLTSAGNLKTAIVEDTVGLAKDTTVAQIRDRLPSSLTSAGNLKVAISEDALGLARDSSLQTIISRLGAGLPSSLTTAGNLRVAVVEDSLGLARDSTLNNLRYRMYGVDPNSTIGVDINDSSTYTVTATSWTKIRTYPIHPRHFPIKTYAYYVIVGIKGRIDTSDQTLYVRVCSGRYGVCSNPKSITSTSDIWTYHSYTVSGSGPLNEWEDIWLEAYVTGGTGYITAFWAYIQPLNTLFLPTGSGDGYRVVPLTAVALADNLSNPTTTLIGAALLGWDPANNVWRRIQVDSQGRLRAVFG
ncbi:hypothetical protein [Pyrobaculum genetic element 1]|nr:hypothetical protein [Pyrobaculum genetic element 1]